MSDIDLNQKVWGFKAKNHFYLFSIIHILVSFFNVLAIIDYIGLPAKVDDEVRHIFFFYLIAPVATICITCCGVAILFCLKFRIVYGILAVLMLVVSVGNLFFTFLSLFMSTLTFDFGDFEKKKKKYYKYGQIGKYISDFSGIFIRIYLGLVLAKIAFFPPKKVIYISRSRSEYDDSDIEDRPKRGRRRTPEKSGKSGKSGNSGNSGYSGQLDKTGRSGNSGNSQE